MKAISPLLRKVVLPESAFLYTNFGNSFAKTALHYVIHLSKLTTNELQMLRPLQYGFDRYIRSNITGVDSRIDNLMAGQLAMSTYIVCIRYALPGHNPTTVAIKTWLSNVSYLIPLDRSRTLQR